VPSNSSALCNRWKTPKQLVGVAGVEPAHCLHVIHDLVAIRVRADLDARARATARELRGVQYQVADHLAQQAAIAARGRQGIDPNLQGSVPVRLSALNIVSDERASSFMSTGRS